MVCRNTLWSPMVCACWNREAAHRLCVMSNLCSAPHVPVSETSGVLLTARFSLFDTRGKMGYLPGSKVPRTRRCRTMH